MELFPVETPYAGPLAVCRRPRSGTWLADDIAALREAGFALLVSVLTREEVAKAGLEGVGEVCRAHGIEFVHYPVGNMLAPTMNTAVPVLEMLRGALREGRGVAMHCWASVGRSPMLAAALMVMEGVAIEEAWRRLRTARGLDVPDTLEQQRWVAAVAEGQRQAR